MRWPLETPQFLSRTAACDPTDIAGDLKYANERERGAQVKKAVLELKN